MPIHNLQVHATRNMNKSPRIRKFVCDKLTSYLIALVKSFKDALHVDGPKNVLSLLAVVLCDFIK